MRKVAFKRCERESQKTIIEEKREKKQKRVSISRHEDRADEKAP
jgi:hypothetical protein